MVAVSERIAMLPDREQTFRMSYEEFVARVEEGAHAEWVDGEAIVFMSPKERHQALSGFLYWLMSTMAYVFDLGLVRYAPYAMRARPDGPAREPDLLFVAREHRARVTANGLIGPADLVVEIISNESYRRDRADKFDEYEEAGIPEYWLIDAREGKERAEFYRLNALGRYEPVLLDAEGRYHSVVLPGFWLKPEWFWREPLPNPVELFAEIAPQVPSIGGPRGQAE
jgi:Uma2 family endonuclease